MGTVHVFIDRTDAARLHEVQKDPVSAVHNRVSADGEGSFSWAETDWKLPALEGVDEELAGKDYIRTKL